MKTDDQTLALVAKLNRNIECDGFTAVLDDHALTIQNAHDEGVDIATLPDGFARILLNTIESQADQVATLKWLHNTLEARWTNAHRAGVKAGRDQVTRTVQELLGLDRIASALEAHIPK